MEEIKKSVKNNSIVIQEIKDTLNTVKNANYATKNELLNQYIVECKTNDATLKIVGETMLDLQEELNEKDDIINEYQTIVGDEKIDKEILTKCRSKKIDDNGQRVREKTQIMQRLTRKMQLSLAQ